MNTLLLSTTCQPEADQLAIIAQNRNWFVDWLSYNPSDRRPKIGNPAIYAETDIALRVAATNDLVLIEPSFDLLARLPFELTKRHIDYTTLGAAKKLKTKSFVKPADCTNKSFEAAVCENGTYLRVSSKIPEHTNVLVSEPALFDIEYRTIVLNRKVATLSPYIRLGRLARDADNQWKTTDDELESVHGIVGQLLDNHAIDLPPAFTLDVGLIENRGWAVIEFNPVWCSGFLGCDLTKIIDPLNAACWKRNTVPDHLSQWIVNRSPRHQK